MKSRRIGLEAEIVKYELGKNLEDGVELLADVVTKGWIVTEFLVKTQRADGSIVCPYIKTRRGYLSVKMIISLLMKTERNMSVGQTKYGAVMKSRKA